MNRRFALVQARNGFKASVMPSSLITGLKTAVISGSLEAVVCFLQDRMNPVRFLPRLLHNAAHFPPEIAAILQPAPIPS